MLRISQNMEVIELLTFPAVLTLLVFVLSLPLITKFVKTRKHRNPNLPPGSLGWPVVGETLEFLRSGYEGKPELFIRERMEKYDSRLFKTSMLGEPMVVFCEAAGNKFIFSNENKDVQVWCPTSVRKLLRSSLVTKVGYEAKTMRKLLMTFLNPEALKTYRAKMDTVACSPINTHWQGKEEVHVYPTVKQYAFELACCLFASIEDPIQVSQLSPKFDEFLKGVISFPINLPGTRFHCAISSKCNKGRAKVDHKEEERGFGREEGLTYPGPSLTFASYIRQKREVFDRNGDYR